ncbi:CU044_5270 family protein [Cellulomonas sp. PhB150]|uniref:CU044_5270 family protein n=1 Tax=Cellulomonas sp. PhB150 TaxID=2485188 RepID=UPI000FBA1F00|nr:CU044_5270 family protein [Cellulomonas sp. PhB150]ROS22963.1 hypothetical protein EDF34_3136 [Cellulomonas sp. PhB150]
MKHDDAARLEAARIRELLNVSPHPGAAPTAEDMAILARILASSTPKITVPKRSPIARMPVTARLAAAFAAIAALVVAGIAVQSRQAPAAATPAMLSFSAISPTEIIEGKSAPAGGALRALASTALSQPPITGTGKQVVKSYAWYWTNQVSEDGTRRIELAPTFQTTSIGIDGSFSNTEVRAPALDTAGRVIDPNHYPAGGKNSTETYPAGSIDPSYPSSLPRDPAKLQAALIDSQGGEAVCGINDLAEASCLYSAVIDLNTRWVVPHDLTSALWSVLADQRPVVDMGEVVDRLGRAGKAFALPPDPSTTNDISIMVLDPTTGQFLAWERVAATLPDLEVAGPAVTSFQAVSDATWSEPSS